MAETAGYERFFPYDDPYPNQREAMDRIADALDSGQDVLMEGAPGTGKTLSALVPALAHAQEHDRTVVITTNVHQQMRQFVADARAIAAEEPIRAVVFKGKASMCHIDVGYEECRSLKETTRSLVEAEAERAELAERNDALLAEMQNGSDEAAAARSAVVDELEQLDDEIAELESANVCEHYRANLERDTDAFHDWLFEGVRTPEEIYEYADEQGLCGYELLKEGMEGIDLVVCNYHHLLDPTIREHFFRWLGRDPEEVITVFDEAHNIESAAREHATRTLSARTLEGALAELDETDDSRAESARNVVEAFLTGLETAVDDALGFGEREQVGDEWHDVAIANDDRRDDLTLAFLDAYEGSGIDAEIDLALQVGEALDEQYEEAYRRGETATRSESATLQAAGFVADWMGKGTDLGRHPMAAVRRDVTTEEVYGRAELYTCIPREVTEGLFDEVAASVLMSATLRPFDVLEDVLGLTEPETMAYGLAYPEERRRTFAVEGPALFSSERDDPETQATVADTLADAIRMTPGNTLVFCPSYAEAERYHDRLDLPDTYLDGSDVSTEDLRQRFVASGADGATLFTSLWGTLGEGVSFDGDDARTVIVLGVPYPNLSERMEAVQAAYDRVYADRPNAGWRYAVEIPTIRKTRQALGRVIRAPDDFGVRILLDKRYTRAGRDMGQYGVRDAFPPGERDELIDIDPEKLKFAMLNFYADLDAYDGDPPAP
ncbi:DNA excision repair protein ERCC-2 [Haloplanus vescus]|uniref:DNA excision repair protein ERCC-2 n=1 Tax=Haloplanus vescus TaxID=555874 RepID=A0A1H3Z211_9EURY|nr:ATP-dependent DNA helicase [Haloplanus vescus]SEA17700.1 DNA excision repair protein ERCC-2 [Haloplanus vescus]